MTGSKLIDSSIWLEYFFNGCHTEFVDNGELLLVSVLTIFEVKNKLIKSKFEQEKVAKCIDFIKKRSLILPVDEEIAEKAVDLKNNLAMADALIYTTAQQHGAILLTRDNDFRGLKNVEII